MKDQKEVVRKVIDYIEQNIEKEINLDNISKSIGYSKFHLNRLFQNRQELQFINIYKTADLRLRLKNWSGLISR